MSKEKSAETQIESIRDTEAFSFTTSAQELGQVWTTKIVSQSIRQPIEDSPDEDSSMAGVESRAHAALGLGPGEPFISIIRARSHDGIPQVIHRVYLRPDRFPPSFLQDHDFAHASLIDIYEKYGYQLKTRNTTLTARIANMYETGDLHVPLGKPVLVAEQELFALDQNTGDLVMLEYLEATYIDWSYRIENRPATQK